MGGHVVGPFIAMPILTRVLRRQAIEECLEIGANVARRVLLNEQCGRGVPAKQSEKTGLDWVTLEPIQDIARNFHEPAAPG